MKKLFYLLLFIPIGLFGQTQIVNVGSAPNDHTGDPIRTAFIKVNTNFAACRDSFGNIYTQNQVIALLSLKANLANPQFTGLIKLGTDTIATKAYARSVSQIFDTLYAPDYFELRADSNKYGHPITRTWFETYGGGGGIIDKFYILSGNIDQIGFPATGDTSLTHTNFIGKHIIVYREGNLQQQHIDNTTQDGYWLDNATGIVRFRPALSANEQLEIWATNTIQWESLVPEGGGGAGASTLLTGLVGYWQLNETSGGTAFDETVNSYDGTIQGPIVNVAGKFGTGYDFDGTNDYVTMGTIAGLRIQTHTISFWIKTTQAAYAGIVSNWIARTGPLYYGYAFTLNPSGVVDYEVDYGATRNKVTSTSAINDGNWHNIIGTFNGTNTNIYIDGGASEDTDATAGTISYHSSCEYRLGDRGEGDLPFDGVIDGVGIWSKVISGAEKTTLQTKTHPWN